MHVLVLWVAVMSATGGTAYVIHENVKVEYKSESSCKEAAEKIEKAKFQCLPVLPKK